ncbi:MAG: phage tail tape measure protein [Clostridiales bacterium]|nr:phage tail tape measure protein [Clostridiales bacterium]
MALKVGELFASFNLDTSGVSGAVNSAEKQLSQLGKGLMIGGGAMTAAVTAPLNAAAKALYTAGSDFDAEMSKVFAIAGESVTGDAKKMEDLRQKALQMGSTTQFTATQAGEAMEYMAMAGWKSEEMLKAIEPMMSLAAAAGADLGTTSDIVTDAMTAFGLAATDMVEVTKDGMKQSVNAVEYFADILAAASSNSNTNVTMLGESFKFVAPQAGSFGYKLNDVALALGLMANNGIKSSMAGTSLSRVIQNMVKPSDDTALAMQALGVSLYDSSGRAKSWREVMEDFRKIAKKGKVDTSKLTKEIADLDKKFQAGKMTEDEYEKALEKLGLGAGGFMRQITQVAGARGLPGLLAIMNATDEDFEKLAYSIDNATGSAKTMAATMLDNAKGDVTILKSAVEGLEITLWSLAEGGFRKVIQDATGVVDSFRTMDSETQKGAMRFAALAAAVGPATLALGTVIKILPKLAHLFTTVSGPAGLLAIGLVALGAAAIDSGNSMGKTFVKAAQAAGKRVRDLGKNVKAQLPQLTKNMNAFLSSLIEGIGKGLPNMLDGLGDILATGINALAGGMRNAGNLAKTIVATIAGGIQRNAPQIVPAVLNLLTEMATTMIRNVPTVVRGMGTIVTSLIEAFQNADWSGMGSSLNTALQESVKELDTWFRRLAMGEKYKQGATWGEVGAALVDNLVEGLQTSLGNARDFLGSLLLGDQYKPDDDWKTFGTKLIDKVFQGADSAVSGASSFVSGILDSLGNLFSAANIASASETLAALVSRIITAAADEIPKLAEHAGNILTKLGELIFGKDGEQGLAASAASGAITIAESIIKAIVAGIPKVINAGSSLIEAVGKLFDKESSGTDLSGSYAGIVQSLVGGITDAVKRLPDLLSGALSVGAQIANAIMSSITSALVDMEASGIAASLGKAATDLVHGLLTSISNFGENADVQSFMKNLGQGFSTAMGMLGDIAGSIVGYILSPEGLTKIFNAGKTLGGLLLNGIKSALGGLSNFFFSLIDNTLIGMGIIDPVTRDAYRQAESVSNTYREMAQEIIKDVGDVWDVDDATVNSDGFREMALLALFGNRGSGSFGDIADISQDYVASFIEAAEAAIQESTGQDLQLDSFADTMWSQLESASHNSGFSADDVKRIMEPFLNTLGIASESLNEDVYAAITAAVAKGGMDNENTLWGMILESILGSSTPEAESTIQQAAESTIQQAAESTKAAVQEATTGIIQAVDESENALAKSGMATAITAGKGDAEKAALDVGDAAVKEFLLTMSAENGTAIGTQFVGAIETVLTDSTLTETARTLADSSYKSVANILNNGAGRNIGVNFGLGLANGIGSTLGAVTTAAYNLGKSAADSLSSAIQEGSPSKLTGKSGRNFGLGFINNILDSVTDARSAAALMGISAAASLNGTVRQMQNEAVNGLSVPVETSRGAAAIRGAQNEQTAQQFAEAVAHAINGMKVEMDGEAVGVLVTPTVSERIAETSMMRRYGTE